MATNIHGKLTRRGVVVPYRTLHRFVVERCGFGRRKASVRVSDGAPGVECQIDFARAKVARYVSRALAGPCDVGRAAAGATAVMVGGLC